MVMVMLSHTHTVLCVTSLRTLRVLCDAASPARPASTARPASPARPASLRCEFAACPLEPCNMYASSLLVL